MKNNMQCCSKLHKTSIVNESVICPIDQPCCDLGLLHVLTRHENFYVQFSLCAGYLLGQKFICCLKVFTDYLEGCICKNIYYCFVQKSKVVGQ